MLGMLRGTLRVATAEQHALYAARRGRGCGSAAADVRAFGLHGQEGAGV